MSFEVRVAVFFNDIEPVGCFWPSSDGVEVLVDVLRNRLDLGAEVIFDREEKRLVIFSNEIDGES